MSGVTTIFVLGLAGELMALWILLPLAFLLGDMARRFGLLPPRGDDDGLHRARICGALMWGGPMFGGPLAAEFSLSWLWGVHAPTPAGWAFAAGSGAVGAFLGASDRCPLTVLPYLTAGYFTGVVVALVVHLVIA